MEPIKISKYDSEALKNLAYNMQRIQKIYNSQNLLVPEVAKTIQTSINAVQASINAIQSTLSSNLVPQLSLIQQLNKEYMRSVSSSINIINSQLKKMPNYTNLLSDSIDKSDAIRTTDRFLKNFDNSMSLDDFKNFSEEIISISKQNIDAGTEPEQKEYYGYEEQILQSVEKINDDSTPSKIREILLEQLITFIFQIILKVVFLVTTGNMNFDLSKEILKIIADWYNSFIS
ncbi:hypothetical protein JXA27_10205 [Aerococcaceae bacterium zg-B36]|uniref:hypothetical protein n=1 Tax=Aerococcaceae bacterium zg-252 TaxID=2796928 RepID=UPI001BD8D179|nr:hypothetical protein [Aerococcaceae bacterium zg-B36]